LKTYDDATRELLNSSVLLPKILLVQTEKLIADKKDLKYANVEDFVEDATRIRLKQLSSRPPQ
jgi:hypothetical protein